MLKEMNRQHTADEYRALVKRMWEILPNCSISQDIIVGFPGETEEDHQDTLRLMEDIKFVFGYMYKYSERPGTMAARKFEDNVPEATKKRRLTEIVNKQREHSAYRTKQFIGKTTEVLIEKESKKDPNQWSGRNEQSIVVVFPKEHHKVGDLVDVKIHDCTSATLIGTSVLQGVKENQ
jgi:tRNA-2-methylthio-N6-dimethylallyladenosine synthase